MTFPAATVERPVRVTFVAPYAQLGARSVTWKRCSSVWIQPGSLLSYLCRVVPWSTVLEHSDTWSR